jgi:hypothetical protein
MPFDRAARIVQFCRINRDSRAVVCNGVQTTVSNTHIGDYNGV